MFLKRTRSGNHIYLQLVEGYRDQGRIRQRVLATLGREDQLDRERLRRLVAQLAAYAEGLHPEDPVGVDTSREFGTLWVLEHLWRELELDRILTEALEDRRFGFDVPTTLKAITFGRVIEPSSERALLQGWLQRVRWPGFEEISLHQTYRALRGLAEAKEIVEAKLCRVLTDKLFADVTLTLFDTTSVPFEGRGPEGLAGYGYSASRPDRIPVKLGLLTSRQGLPLAHWLFPGSQVDAVSFAQACRHFRRRLPVGDFAVVADRGMVSDGPPPTGISGTRSCREGSG